MLRKWLWERAGFMLAVFVLGGLFLGWFLPATEQLVEIFAFGQIIMAVVVLAREAPKLADGGKLL